MGLASSQARLLTLTARMHDIEYKAARLEAQKLQMANESTRVYEDYLNALDATKIQYNILSTDGSTTYVDATYNNLIAAGYVLEFANAKVQVTQETIDNFEYAAGNADLFVALETGRDTVIRNSATGEIEQLYNEQDQVYEIYNVSQLMAMSGSSEAYRLMSDITITEDDNWSGITDFGGTFDGNGHTVTIESGTNGLFANTTNGATISNVNVVANISSTSDKVGALIGSAVGTTVDNCSVSGSVASSGKRVGGAIGSATSGCTVTNSTSNCDVSCTYNASDDNTDTFAGGFVGYIDSSDTYFENCIATGNVSNTGVYSGGFFGCVAGSYDNIDGVNYGKYVGTTIFTNCAATGNVYSGINLSGQEGSAGERNYDKCAGAFGASNNAAYIIFENCYAGGSVYCGENEDNSKNHLFYYCTDNANTAEFTERIQITDCSASTCTGIGSTITSHSEYTDSVTQGSSSTVSTSGANTRTTCTVYGTTASYNAKALYEKMQENGYILIGEDDDYGWADGWQDSNTWLTNMVNMGELYIYQYNSSTGEYEQTSVSTNTGLQEVSDEVALKKAEAKYEADMKKIDLKDRKYDTDLAAIENEREAIKDEIDTLKTVAKDNVERTFKLFS